MYVLCFTCFIFYIIWLADCMQGFTFEKNRRATNRSPKYAKLIEASDLLFLPCGGATISLFGFCRRHEIFIGTFWRYDLCNERNVYFSKPRTLQLVNRITPWAETTFLRIPLLTWDNRAENFNDTSLQLVTIPCNMPS